MSDRTVDLLALSKAVPTLELKLKIEDEGKTYLMAGDDPIFRCRTSELGEAYGLLVIGAVELLPKALSAIEAPEDGVGQTDLGEPLKTEITSKIVQLLSLQSDLRPKAELAGKLVFSAIEPYLRGSAADSGFPTVEASVCSQASTVDQASIRRDAVQDFAGWLVEEGRLGKLRNEQDLADLCEEWDDSKNA